MIWAELTHHVIHYNQIKDIVTFLEQNLISYNVLTIA